MCEIIVSKDMIHLCNHDISYCIGLPDCGIPFHLYYGKKLDRPYLPSLLAIMGIEPEQGSVSLQNCALDNLLLEYPSFGLGDFREDAISVRRNDGTSSVDLRLTGTETVCGKPPLEGLPSTFATDCKTLIMHLEDTLLHLNVDLYYTIFSDCNVIARSARIRNDGEDSVRLEKAFSFCLDLQDRKYDLLTLYGDWGREREWTRRPLTRGDQGIGTRKGASSLQMTPFMALLRPDTTETNGEVYAFSLVYSGNFWAGVHVDRNDRPRCLIGMNPSGFSWLLNPGEAFQTPEAVSVWTENGLDGMSTQFHRLCTDHLVRGKYAHAERPILLNSWEANYFDFNEEKLLHQAEIAAQMSIEMFVLDDGWFGHRDDSHSSLGDWKADPRKLPGGLARLARGINKLGMKFGLWFEPEMVSPDSDLYRVHPDWCIHIDGREHILGRNQLILDLSRPEVCAYIHDAVATVLSENAISYVKWDMNRNMTNIGSAYLSSERQQELPHRYMLGLYSILERLTGEFPDVLFESCAGGGGRFDMGMLYYSPQIWCSDNTDALCRCRIQYSTSLVFPQYTMGSHVSAVPNHQTLRSTPLQTRANVAMSGCFGYELNVDELSTEEQDAIRNQIAFYRPLRHTLLYGNFHRLISPYEGNESAWITVSEDQKEAVAVYVRMLGNSRYVPETLRLRGLNPEFMYRIGDTDVVRSGADLMQVGIVRTVHFGDAQSECWVLRAE